MVGAGSTETPSTAQLGRGFAFGYINEDKLRFGIVVFHLSTAIETSWRAKNEDSSRCIARLVFQKFKPSQDAFIQTSDLLTQFDVV